MAKYETHTGDTPNIRDVDRDTKVTVNTDNAGVKVLCIATHNDAKRIVIAMNLLDAVEAGTCEVVEDGRPLSWEEVRHAR